MVTTTDWVFRGKYCLEGNDERSIDHMKQRGVLRNLAHHMNKVGNPSDPKSLQTSDLGSISSFRNVTAVSRRPLLISNGPKISPNPRLWCVAPQEPSRESHILSVSSKRLVTSYRKLFHRCYICGLPIRVGKPEAHLPPCLAFILLIRAAVLLI